MPGFCLPHDRPALVGVLNVTPDSFSDGGQFTKTDDAVSRGVAMMAEGADLVDVGGESTRPGAQPVSAAEEMDRILPVIKGLAKAGVPVSIDTTKANVARAALLAGAVVLNDISALADPDMADVARGAGVPVCLMHRRGTPQTMQSSPEYADVVQEVIDYLAARAQFAQDQGIAQACIWLDPGIGFGKTTAHNLTLLRALPRLVALGYPVLIGASRKAFLGRILGSESEPVPVMEREEATLTVHTLAQAYGARLVRTHEVRAGFRALTIAQAVLCASA